MRSHEKHTEIYPLISSYFRRHKLISVLDESKVGLVICDRKLRYKALNESAAEIHNEPVKAHLGRSLDKILGNFAEKVVPLWENVLVSGYPYTNLEVAGKLPKRSGVGRWVENLFPLTDRRGRVEHVGCFVIEIIPRPLSTSSRPSAFGNEKSMVGSQTSAPDRRKPIVLSHREQEVLRMLVEGENARDIGSSLDISVRTVETYRSRLMLKLGARSIVELVHYAIQNGIIKI